MRIRIKDVAERAGVSTATVSRVLANKPPIGEAVRKRVEQAAAELGYQPDRVARALRTRQSRSIGVIVPDIQNPFFIGIIRTIQDMFYEHQYIVFLCNTDEDPEKEALCVELMKAETVAGVIVAPARESSLPFHRLAGTGMPMAIIDRRLTDLSVDTVVVDNLGASQRLVNHLIADGHRRIGAVLGSAVATTGRERRDGYLRALEEHGLPIQAELIGQGTPDQINRDGVGYQLTQALLDLPEPPTALFTGSNLLTIGALRAIHERRLRMPDDIALAAFDEINWMSAVSPALTVVAQPVHELGRIAAELLFRQITDGPQPAREIVLQPSLVIRQSCAHHPSSANVQDVSDIAATIME